MGSSGQLTAGSSPGVDLASVQELCDLKGEELYKNICGGYDLWDLLEDLGVYLFWDKRLWKVEGIEMGWTCIMSPCAVRSG